MKLQFPFFKSKKEAPIYYLGLIITPEKVSSVVFEEYVKKIRLVNRDEKFFSGSFDELSLEDVIETVDSAITPLEEVLPPDVEIRETVFGVADEWVDQESKKIKKEYLKKLKEVCEKLSLTPIGFMVMTEAIANLIQSEEGAPLSAILAEIGRTSVSLTLLRGGKSIQRVTGEIKENIPHTIDGLMKGFTADALPARIVLYGNDNGENLAQKLAAFHWSKSLPFLHMPQISMLSADFNSRAVSFGAAQQMGFEVPSGIIDHIKNYETDKHDHVVSSAVAEEDGLGALQKDEVSMDKSVHGDNFGFVIDQDVEEKIIKDEHLESDDQSTRAHKSAEETQVLQESYDSEPDLGAEDSDDVGRNKTGFVQIVTEKIRSGLPEMPSVSIGRFKLILIPAVLLAVIAGGIYYFYTYVMSASVVVALAPENKVKTEEIVFATDSENDFDENILKASEIEDTISGEETVDATGEKEVGEKARGTVTVYNNNTSSSVNLPKGAVLSTSGDLDFVTDKDIKVASASGDIFSGTKPGTADVEVTAEEIGSDYNLPSGMKFSVDGNSSLAAKNDKAFSGGSSKKITVVSKKDLDKLNSSLTASLEKEAESVLGAKTQKDESVLPVLLSTKIQTAKYDKKEGDEAKKVNVEASLQFTGLSYDKERLNDFAKKMLEKENSGDKDIREEDISAEIKDVEKISDARVSATVVISGSLLPKIDSAGLAKELGGKSKEEFKSAISKLPQVDHTSIVYKPGVPFVADIFPFLPKNVTVTLASD